MPVVRFSVALWEMAFRVALTVAVPFVPIRPAVARKAPVVDPAVIMIADGTITSGLLLDTETTLQPDGTGLVKVIVHVLTKLEIKVVGPQLRDDTPSPDTRLRPMFCELPFSVAETVAVWLLAKLAVVALKVVEVEPAGTTAEGGAVSVALLLDRDTVTPPVGAALLKVIVQVLDAFCPKVVGAQAKEDTSTGAVRLRLAAWGVPFKVAVTTAA